MRPSFSIAVGTDAVRGIVPSLDGREAVAVLGENRPSFMGHVSRAALLRIEGRQLALGTPPAFATETMFALGAGEVAAARISHNEVELLRRAGATPLMSAMELSAVAVMLAPDGREFRVRAVETDYGHGWTHPVHTRKAFRVALDGGARVETTWFDDLRAAGSPVLYEGGQGGVLGRLVDGLPFRREWPVCVGPRLLLTTTRVIDVRSGETLVGERNDTFVPPRAFFDLRADESSAVAVGADGMIELWDIGRRSVKRIPELGETRCAAFIGDRLLAGGADGRVHLLS